MTKRKGLILCLVVAALMLLAGAAVASEVDPVSYTHLDVYKRQPYQ